MALTADVAIVTAAEVAAITHEDGLSNLDGSTPASGATLANALIQATNALIAKLRARDSFDPAKVSNTSDLKHAAAYWIAYTCFASQPQDDEVKEKTALYKARYEEAVREYVFVSSDTTDPLYAKGEKGLPRMVNVDSFPNTNVPGGPYLPDARPGRIWGGGLASHRGY